MKKIQMPSQKKFYNLGNGWSLKETYDGARALYHASINYQGEDPGLRQASNLQEMGPFNATVYSDDWTKVRAGRRASPNTSGQSARTIFWNFASLPAGNIADVLVCGKIYKHDRIIGGLECHTALSSGGGTATGSYGTYAVLADSLSLGAVDSAAKFLAATSFEAAGSNAIANTIALAFGYEATADFFLVCVNSVEAFATAGQVSGYMNVLRA